MRLTIIGWVVKIFPAKQLTETYVVRSFAVSYPSSKNITQTRLVQAVGKEVVNTLDKIKLHDQVELTVELRGKVKTIINREGLPAEVIANVDECYNIKKL